MLRCYYFLTQGVPSEWWDNFTSIYDTVYCINSVAKSGMLGLIDLLRSETFIAMFPLLMSAAWMTVHEYLKWQQEESPEIQINLSKIALLIKS
jgi:hypothetical protein